MAATDGNEDIVDLTVGSRREMPVDGESGEPRAGRRYLRLYFRCANQYTRAYLNREGTGYQGRCPSCGKCMNFRIGPGGSKERFFGLSC
ncbi:MAG: hypothetical protein AB7K52_04080 [Phycisphaerales bacterium]